MRERNTRLVGYNILHGEFKLLLYYVLSPLVAWDNAGCQKESLSPQTTNF